MEARSITLPDVMGQSKREAEAALRGAGVQGEIKVDNDPGSVNFAVATVCSQVPGGGRETSSGLFVSLRYCQPAADNGAANRAIELVGVTIPEATRLAKVAGFEGKIKVDQLDNYDASCKASTVCRVTPINWRSERELTLSTNKTTTISVPD